MSPCFAIIRKIEKNETTVKQTVTESLINFTQPGLRPVGPT